MSDQTLPTDAILNHFGLGREAPGFDYLRRLLLAHREHVPYETATRLLRYRDIANAEDQVRLPEAFWAEHLAVGAGGSCSDNSYAFKRLIDTLGFDATMAINTEGDVTRDAADRVLDFPRVRSHSSVIVHVARQRYVADPCSGHVVKVPLPIGLPYRVDVSGKTDEGRAYHYAIEPLGDDHYELHNIGPDGEDITPGDADTGRPTRGQMYIFYDRAVSDDAFEDHMLYGYRNHYASHHLSMLRRDPKTKTEYSFSSQSSGWQSINGSWEQLPLGDDPAHTLERYFGLPYERLTEAWAYLRSVKKD